MKRIVLAIVITMILTFLATFTITINNIQISDIEGNNITIEIFNNKFIYNFEK